MMALFCDEGLELDWFVEHGRTNSLVQLAASINLEKGSFSKKILYSSTILWRQMSTNILSLLDHKSPRLCHETFPRVRPSLLLDADLYGLA